MDGARAAALLAAAPAAILTCDEAGVVGWASPYAEAVFGEPLVGRRLVELVIEDDRAVVAVLVARVVVGSERRPVVCRVRLASGATLDLAARDGPEAAVVVVAHNATAEVLALEAALLRDSHTGLPNFRALQRRFDTAPPTGSLLLVDIDGTRTWNDQYGHGFGDQLLREVAERLAAVATTGAGEAFRVGGQEFVVLLPGDLQAAAGAAEEARREVYGIATPDGGKRVTLTVGVGSMADGGDTAMCDASEALYRAKGAGRDRVEVAPRRQRPLIDPLTRVGSTRALHAPLDAPVEPGAGATSAAIYLDLDRYGEANRAAGLADADHLLRRFGRLLREVAAASGAEVFRYGGDEFVLLLGDSSVDEARGTAELLRRALAASDLRAAAGVPALTATVGVAHGRRASDDGAAELVERARRLMMDARLRLGPGSIATDVGGPT